MLSDLYVVYRTLVIYDTRPSDSKRLYPIIARGVEYDSPGATRILVNEDNMNRVRESTQEKKRTLVLGGTSKAGQPTTR